MGVRKREMADRIKAEKKQIAFAKLNNCPTSPRKMRLVADLVRGVKVEKDKWGYIVRYPKGFFRFGADVLPSYGCSSREGTRVLDAAQSLADCVMADIAEQESAGLISR